MERPRCARCGRDAHDGACAYAARQGRVVIPAGTLQPGQHFRIESALGREPLDPELLQAELEQQSAPRRGRAAPRAKMNADDLRELADEPPRVRAPGACAPRATVPWHPELSGELSGHTMRALQLTARIAAEQRWTAAALRARTRWHETSIPGALVRVAVRFGMIR